MSEEGKTKFSFKNSWNCIYTTMLNIIDYDEIDLATFLNRKKKEKYNLFIFSTSILMILAYFLSFLYSYVYFLLSPKFPCDYILNSLYGIVLLFLLFIGEKISNHFLNKINYMKSLYYKERKFLLKNIEKINLLINNQFLKKKVGSNSYNDIKSQYNILKERIDVYSNVFKPYYYLDVILKLIPFFAVYFSIIISNTNNLEILIPFLLTPIMFIGFIIFSIHSTQYKNTKELLNKRINLTKKKDKLIDLLYFFLDSLEKTHMSYHNETKLNLKVNKSLYRDLFCINIIIIIIMIIILFFI